MAKRRKKRKRLPQRDNVKIPNYNDVLRRYGFTFKKKFAFSRDIVEDLRKFDPHLDDYRRLEDGKISNIRLSKKKTPTALRDPTRARLAFVYPNKTMVCKKRRIRRRVLFVLAKAGVGIRGPKLRKFNMDSKIKC